MSNLLVQNIKHTNNTTGVTIDSSGFVDFPQSSMIQQWVLTANTTSDTTLTNFSEVSTTFYASMGASMSHSSGVFTFPITGLYKIHSTFMMKNASGSQDNSMGVRTQGSNDSGGSFEDIIRVFDGGTNNLFSGVSGMALINVTNASTFRVRFFADSLASGSIIFGTTAYTASNVLFERIGNSQ